jgi:hypothetical protein
MFPVPGAGAKEMVFLTNRILKANWYKIINQCLYYTKLHSKIERGGDDEPTLPAGGQAQVRAKQVEGVAPTALPLEWAT